GVEVLREAGNAGVGVRRECGIVLVVVLQRDGVLASGVVIEVGYAHVGFEAAGAGKKGIEGVLRREAYAAIVGDEPFAGLAGKRGNVEESDCGGVGRSGRCATEIELIGGRTE